MPFSGGMSITRELLDAGVLAIGDGYRAKIDPVFLFYWMQGDEFRDWRPREGDEGVAKLGVHELQLLLWNGNPAQAQAAPIAYRWSLVPLLQSDDGDRVKKSEIGEDQGFTKPVVLSIIHGPSPP